jgi:hypothetical protein
VSLVARVIRQFYEGAEAVSLERMVALPFQPTMGTKLDLGRPGRRGAAGGRRGHPPSPR